MTANELRRKYIEFFVKQCGHKEISSASIIPENDPTVLFTTAGMHPLVPYFVGEPHPAGKRLTDVQKCVRTDDIDEVGDMTHCTFFEMLGNWSLGDYFKKEAIEFSYNFLTLPDEKGGLGFDIKNLAFSCFAGDSDAPRDDEAANAWKSFGISDERIAFLPKKNNWWGPAGKTGPCGPDTEMFYWTGEGSAPKKFDPDDANWVEIWNDVFMKYNKTAEGKYEPLAQTNVDTGMGFERTFAILQGKKSCFETELFTDAMTKLRILANYEKTESNLKSERIILDHLRAVTFIMGDNLGVTPSNVDQGYIVRRLARRAIRHGKILGINENFTDKIAEIFIEVYGDYYTELQKNRERILSELQKEEEKFANTIVRGEREFQRILPEVFEKKLDTIPGDVAFNLYETYGFPIELIEELAKEKSLKVDRKLFDEEYKKHQDMSRAGALQKFAGGLADHSEEVRKLHTATHLLNKALRQILGDHVYQKGSNITAERLRFDFSHPQKVTPEELAKIEAIVNEQIKANLPIHFEEMTVDEAKNKGAIGVFDAKYGDKVKVYFMGDFSKEICGGPHANNTGDLKSFKILKEEAVASGIRRIKAVIG
ncbi:MAG: alanyl-tRNA synthetase, alanyl-tRNA synthetase [Candidatus Peregrinibacteria bacterium GW2011_GWC2_39_14]|nr:MAG: Alanine-tRNA ligase [Candidatus Peregrinibacteria bacterium GW2011_GWA2_38_36]KKR05220.1 MAG: alanyl-tRNA synthetase, alanyl-tRNA synthetase [Candidatus Peregrinibacteria bacterium GW2011_GWC2_39_14]